MTKKETSTPTKSINAVVSEQDHASHFGDIELNMRIRKQIDQAQQQFADKLLLEAYGRKRKLLQFSFWQGVLFGLGSAIGGTLVLAVLLWVLTQMVDWFPILSDLINKIIEHTARR